MRLASSLAIGFVLLFTAGVAMASDPPTPSGAHPRLFMSTANLAQFTANAKSSGTAAAALVKECQNTIDKPGDYTSRACADCNYWPNSAVVCAFAYLATQQSKYLTQAITYWKASLNDDQTLGDGLGCTLANSTYDWTKWDGNPPVPGVLLTVSHDTGYPLRWYGPDLSLTYDWLYSAPGVDDNLRTQTRNCLTAWIDHYTASGFLNNQAGFNYNSGFVVAKTLGAIAIGTDGAADGHLWTQTIHDVFATMLVGGGLSGATADAGSPAAAGVCQNAYSCPGTTGNMVGGDWGSWEYGPLGVMHYAVATRAMEESGVPQPEMDAWVNSLAVRSVYGTLPKMDMETMGNGDFDSTDIYVSPPVEERDAVLVGPSSDQAAGWALYMKQQQKLTGNMVYDALAEARQVTASDYRAQTPAPPLWYVARGTGTMYVRTAWDQNAFWGVFMSDAEHSDHQRFAATNFVFSRGGDHLIVDSSNYGESGTLESNALAADTGNTGDYAITQGPWSTATLPWARGSADAVFAARGDFTRAFDYRGAKSDIVYAHREWALLPEGEIATIDRVHTGSATHNMYLNFHANTGGTLKINSTTGIAAGTVGGSSLAIHPVLISGGTPTIVKPPVGGCTLSCSTPCGQCAAARFAVDEYSLKVPGPWAVAIHVIDGLASSDQPAEVGSLNDDNFDPAPKQNAGVIGAAVFRASKQSYVVASAAQDGVSPTNMTYGVPGGSAARHIVYDAPEASDGTSAVTVSAQSGRCVISITAGSGGGFAGHPLMFQVAAAASACAATEDTNVMPGMPPPGGGVSALDGGAGAYGGADGGAVNHNSNSSRASGGCGCATFASAKHAPVGLLLLLPLVARRRKRR
jgi:hypothetical protein